MITEIIILWELHCVFSFSLCTVAVADMLHESLATRFSVSNSVELSSADDMQNEEGTWKIRLSGGRSQNATVIHQACMAARSTVAPPVCNPLFISINILFLFFLASQLLSLPPKS